MHSSIASVSDRATRRLVALRDLFLTIRDPHAQVPLVAFVSLETQTCWATFLRSYYLGSCVGGYTRSGGRVSGHLEASVEDALVHAVTEFSRNPASRATVVNHRTEPNWTNPATVAKLLEGKGMSNYPGFRRALGLSAGRHEEFSTYRNFVAHRNRDTALKVHSLAARRGIHGYGDPLEVGFHVARRPSKVLFLDWIDRFIAVSSEVPT